MYLPSKTVTQTPTVVRVSRTCCPSAASVCLDLLLLPRPPMVPSLNGTPPVATGEPARMRFATSSFSFGPSGRRTYFSVAARRTVQGTSAARPSEEPCRPLAHSLNCRRPLVSTSSTGVSTAPTAGTKLESEGNGKIKKVTVKLR